MPGRPAQSARWGEAHARGTERDVLAISVRGGAVDPDRHSRLHGSSLLIRVDAEEEAVEVMIADRAGGAPDGELTERSKLSDLGVDPVALRGQQPHRRADCHSREQVLADGESEPALIRGRESQNRLSGRDDLAQFGHEQGHDAVDRSDERGLGELGFDIRERRLGIGDLRLRDRALLSSRAGPVLRVSGFSLVELGLGLAERRGSLVKLLLAGEGLGRERSGSGVLLLREGKIGFGDANLLRRRVDFFLADACIDIRAVGSRRCCSPRRPSRRSSVLPGLVGLLR